LIQQPQLTRPLINGKSADGTTFFTRKLFDFIDCVQIAPAWSEGQKRRILDTFGVGDMP
jgi:hypothetical protein